MRVVGATALRPEEKGATPSDGHPFHEHHYTSKYAIFHLSRKGTLVTLRLVSQELLVRPTIENLRPYPRPDAANLWTSAQRSS